MKQCATDSEVFRKAFRGFGATIESALANCYYGSASLPGQSYARSVAQAPGNSSLEDFHVNRRKFVLGCAPAMGLISGGLAIAQEPPAEDIDPHRHPNLAEAQHHMRAAFDALNRAQGANDFDMEGHAAHAKQLLHEAAHETKASAEWSNRNRR
jgi:hypothetical protein